MFPEGSTILERYALAKEAGFKAVESGFPFGHTLEQVRQAKESAGIEQVLINLKTGAYFYYSMTFKLYVIHILHLCNFLFFCTLYLILFIY